MLPKLKLSSSIVMPTIYSDSLSYYEELNKIKWYINQLIDEIGEASGMFEEINKEIKELQDAVEAIEGYVEFKDGDTYTNSTKTYYPVYVTGASTFSIVVSLPKNKEDLSLTLTKLSGNFYSADGTRLVQNFSFSGNVGSWAFYAIDGNSARLDITTREAFTDENINHTIGTMVVDAEGLEITFSE